MDASVGETPDAEETKESSGKIKKIWLNPILITIAFMIVFLSVTGISYDTYSQAGAKIEFWLKPAVVALGVPLYRQMRSIRQQFVPILMSQLVGCVVGIVSAMMIAKYLGAPDSIILSLAAKSVTTPIAMEVTQTLGGIPSLTAAIVVIVGIFGAVFGFKILEIGRIRRPDSQGLSIGAASHAMGTSAAIEHGEEEGVYSSLALILNGVLTAILSSFIVGMIL